MFKIFRILRTQPQHPLILGVLKKGLPQGVILFLGSCKRFAFSNIFKHCLLHYDEL